MKSLLTSLLRYLKQRKLNRTHELIAQFNALIDYWDTFSMAGHTDGRKPAYVINNLGDWRGERAKLIVRANRLEKELSQS